MVNKKILIVDDDPILLRGLQLRFKANHYNTFLATDAISSISEARNCEPDLIILDIGLPAGDGFVVMDRLKAIPTLAMIPIVVLSAREAWGNQERAMNAGATAFLQKPADSVELLSVVRQALGETAPPKKQIVYDLTWCQDAADQARSTKSD